MGTGTPAHSTNVPVPMAFYCYILFDGSFGRMDYNVFFDRLLQIYHERFL